MITATAFPRAALIGNPSDGYFGKTIAFVFTNFKAEVTIEPSAQLEIIPGERDKLVYENVPAFVKSIRLDGYYGGIRLIKATIRKFHDYCELHKKKIHRNNFTIRYTTDIPGRLGLAGSSAIITAAMKALMQFYKVRITNPVLANLVLAVEKEELHIGAGLQDRVTQAFGCPVFMNFDRKFMEAKGHGEYLPFDKKILPQLYIAYRENLSEGSEVTHNNLAERYARKEAAVVEAVAQWQHLTEQVWEKLQRGDKNIGMLLNRNFDIRRTVCEISKGNIELVEAGRTTGASAKFTGSGGAIIGTFENQQMLENLKAVLKKKNATLIIPQIP